jgi:hypothetical protein
MRIGAKGKGRVFEAKGAQGESFAEAREKFTKATAKGANREIGVPGNAANS